MIVKGKTSSGFKYSVNSNIKEDFDFLNAVEELQNGNYSLGQVKTVFELLIGADGFDALKEHVRKKNDGCANIRVLMTEFNEIASNPELKN